MKTSEARSSEPSESSHKKIAIAFLILSLLGFIDATYLTVAHFRGGIVPCGNIGNCEQVLTSEYAVVWGVPLALMGALYYFSLFLLSYLSLSRREKKYLVAASWIVAAGFLASLALVYLQLFVIHAICLYCMFSASVTTALFICAIYYQTRAGRAVQV